MKIFKYRWLNHILFWIIIFSFFTAPRILTYGFTREAFVNFLYIPVDIAAVYVIIEFLIPRFIIRKRNLLLFGIGAVITIALNITVSEFIMYFIQPKLGFWMMSREFFYELFNFLVNNLMIIGMASALKLFRSQINPHFLFNVLNNIDSLIFEDKEKASNAIFLLSKIMRYMLKESNEEKAMLDKELDYIKDYLELASLSFEDPEFLEFNFSGDFSGKDIPPLLFIPIIENSIKHCNKQSKSPGVKIFFKVENDFIELRTSNFIKRNDFKLPDAGSGSGLKNVEKRLKLLYSENYIFEINSNIDKFEVYLKVPLL